VPAEHAGPRSLRQLLDAVLTVGSDLELKTVLQRITEAATALVDARYGALGVLDNTGTGLAEFITVGVDDETYRAIGDVPKGLGILGSLIADARPLRLADISEHPDSAGFPPNHPPMRSFLGVPIRVHDTVFGNLYLTDKTTAEVFTDVDEELVLGLAAAAGVAIHNARLYEDTRRREAELAGLQEVAMALLAGTDTHAILEVVAARARELVDAELATIALPDERGATFTIQVAVGAHADDVLGQAFDRTGSITARVLDAREPLAVGDLSRDPRVTQPQVRLGMLGPAVFVPLGGPDQVFGSLSVSRAVGSPQFASREVEVLQQFAGQAGVVIDYGRTREDLHRLSLLEDQERIARDLHDTVIQRLFATGLSLQGATRLIRDDEVRRRVEAAVEELDTTVRHIRTVIFDVEAPRFGSASTRRQVVELTREAARALGFQPRVSFDGPVDVEVSSDVADDLLPVLREALSNVARHAQAQSVTVLVTVGSDVVLLVGDDGVGPPSDVQSSGHGLTNMRARAERHGGRFTIRRGDTGGTVVEWRVPKH
jgi:signal transduction histidine kinase